MDELAWVDAVGTAELVRTGAISAAEAVAAAIARVERINPAINAVIHPLFEQARARLAHDPIEGPFAGVPIVIKDLDGALTDAPNHRGNQQLKAIGHRDDHDSFLNARLKRSGFIPIGRSNTPEFGLQPTTEPVAYGATANPWNVAHSPGGSSGGSAAAVAAGLVPVAHAGDGGGSIRIPASACGLFGLKPSRGRVSLGPDQGDAWGGLVQRHVVTRSVRDSAAILDVLAGPETGDPYTAPAPTTSFARATERNPRPLRIAFTTEPVAALCEVDPECIAAVHDAATLLESLGHEVVEQTPDAYRAGGDAFGDFVTVLSAWVARDVDELSEILGRAATADDVEPVTWLYSELGRATNAAQYASALSRIQRWTRDAMAEFNDPGAWHHEGHTPSPGYDLLLTPTCAVPPVALGHLTSDTDDPMDSAGRATPIAVFTAPANITGQPAMSVPLWYQDHTHLPIGVQFLAPMYEEATLFSLAAQLEQARPWADRHPTVNAG